LEDDLRNGLLDLDVKEDPLLGGHALEHVGHPAEEVAHPKFLRTRPEVARLHLREVEDVGDLIRKKLLGLVVVLENVYREVILF
jgi:hypothetical protein